MFQIGEFSTIARVSGRLLRYYDEIGLLRPARIDPESGYRFYSTEQLPRLNRILALKELGLTLDEISRLLEDDLPLDEMRRMLTVKQAEMEQALGDGMRRIRSIQLRLKQIEEAGGFTEYDIVLKPIPAHRILGSRQIVLNTEQGFQLAMQLAQQIPEQVGPEKLDRFVVTLFSEEWKQENLDVEMGYILATEPPGRLELPGEQELTVREVPATENAATYITRGALEYGDVAYNAVGTWMEANDFRFGGQFREVLLEPPDPDHMDELSREIQVPVEKAGTLSDLLA